jgi:hypothetical protein
MMEDGRGKMSYPRCFYKKTEVKSKKVAQKFLISEIIHNFAAEDCNYEE